MLDATQLAPLGTGPGQTLPTYDGAIDALLRRHLQDAARPE